MDIFKGLRASTVKVAGLMRCCVHLKVAGLIRWYNTVSRKAGRGGSVNNNNS